MKTIYQLYQAISWPLLSIDHRTDNMLFSSYFNHIFVRSICAFLQFEQSVVEKLPSSVKLVSPFRKPINQDFW